MYRRILCVAVCILLCAAFAPWAPGAASGRITFAQPAVAAQSVGPTPEILVEVAEITPDGHRPVFASSVRGRPADVEVDPGVYDVFVQEPHSGIIVRLTPNSIVLADGEAEQVPSPESVGFGALARARHAAWKTRVQGQFAQMPDAPYVDGDVLVRFRAGSPISTIHLAAATVDAFDVRRIQSLEIYKVSSDVTTQPDLGRPLAGRCVSGLGSRHDPSTIVPPRPA
jgi:hypothetical protein